MNLTPGDDVVFKWLALVECSTYEDLAAATGRTPDALRHRLPSLKRAGYLQRRLVQDGHRFTALWFPTAAATERLRHRELRIPPAQTDHVDATRAAHLARALLPHFQPPDDAEHIYRGQPLAARIDRLIYTAGMKGVTLSPMETAALHRLPDLLVEHERCLTAIELRLGASSESWNQRLAAYTLLGVTHLEIHTDLPLLEPCLRRAPRHLSTPLVRVIHVRDNLAGPTTSQ